MVRCRKVVVVLLAPGRERAVPPRKATVGLLFRILYLIRFPPSITLTCRVPPLVVKMKPFIQMEAAPTVMLVLNLGKAGHAMTLCPET